MRATEPALPTDRDARDAGLSRLEQERRSSLTAILAPAEILRDYSRELAGRERERFLQAIIDESTRLQRSFEAAS
jgi:K+-sensing histidine kinase KdpD